MDRLNDRRRESIDRTMRPGRDGADSVGTGRLSLHVPGRPHPVSRLRLRDPGCGDLVCGQHRRVNSDIPVGVPS